MPRVYERLRDLEVHVHGLETRLLARRFRVERGCFEGLGFRV